MSAAVKPLGVSLNVKCSVVLWPGLRLAASPLMASVGASVSSTKLVLPAALVLPPPSVALALTLTVPWPRVASSVALKPTDTGLALPARLLLTSWPLALKTTLTVTPLAAVTVMAALLATLAFCIAAKGVSTGAAGGVLVSLLPLPAAAPTPARATPRPRMGQIPKLLAATGAAAAGAGAALSTPIRTSSGLDGATFAATISSQALPSGCAITGASALVAGARRSSSIDAPAGALSGARMSTRVSVVVLSASSVPALSVALASRLSSGASWSVKWIVRAGSASCNTICSPDLRTTTMSAPARCRFCTSASLTSISMDEAGACSATTSEPGACWFVSVILISLCVQLFERFSTS